MSIRLATWGDLADVAEIYAHYVRDSVATFEFDAPGAADWRARLDWCAVRGLPFLVAEEQDGIAGYAYCSPWRDRPAYRHTVQDSVYLSPHATGRGIGSKLLAELIDGCAGSRAHQMVAIIADPGEPSSLALHRRAGFTEVGRLRQVGYKHEQWLDTVLMQRSLPQR